MGPACLLVVVLVVVLVLLLVLLLLLLPKRVAQWPEHCDVAAGAERVGSSCAAKASAPVVSGRRRHRRRLLR